MNIERQGFHISHVYSLGQSYHNFDLVTLTLNFESHTLNVAFHIWLPLGELRCLLTTLVRLCCRRGHTVSQTHLDFFNCV